MVLAGQTKQVMFECPSMTYGARRPHRTNNFYKGVKTNMSVLRKRSPWVLSAAVLGILTMGLAGCGGGDDDTPFPAPDEFFIVPALAPQQAQAVQGIPAGQGGTIRVENINPATHNGVTTALVTFPVGTAGEAETFGLALVPTEQGGIRTVQRTNSNALNGTIGHVTPIAEFLIGPVRPDGTIDTENIPNVPLTYSVDLTEAQANFLASQLGTNRVFQVFRVVNGVAQSDLECEVQFVRVNRRVTVTKCKGGRAIVTHRPRPHRQGGGHSG